MIFQLIFVLKLLANQYPITHLVTDFEKKTKRNTNISFTVSINHKSSIYVYGRPPFFSYRFLNCVTGESAKNLKDIFSLHLHVQKEYGPLLPSG